RNGPRDLRRSYSVWEYDPPRGRLELAVYDHGGEAPGTSWARRVGPGDEIIVTRPEGRLVTSPEPGLQLFVGEDTAAVSFGAMLRALPASAVVRGVVECDEEDDRLPLPRAAELTWVYRRGASAANSALLPAALADLDLSADAPGAAYVVGEVRTCQAVRRHLIEERGWPRQKVLVRAFWTPGRRGMD
ncbi:siderophore-interacting protein, partial [Frankia sp. EI5c]|uniref:siderophore-interacting protein n=1 Tax=Frankia sp. EI5c TaxID=683316 RepID=UPI001F5B1A08